MPRIGFIALDDRPCTRTFPNRIARIANINTIQPPIEGLGHFLTPGKPAIIKKWLLDAAPSLDYLIISIDMLAYGGLINSRTPQVSVDEAFQRLSVLERVKDSNPRLQIYAWNVLMRISITVHDNVTACYWEQMNRYSVLWAKSQLGPFLEEEQMRLSTLEREIPVGVRDAYFQARERNHQVNHRTISLVEKGVIDTLILCQEDAHPIGPHKLEQQNLLERIKPYDLHKRIFLHPGADESGLNLLARVFCKHYQENPSIDFGFFPDDAKNNVPIFEDVPLGESVISQSEACGLRVDAKNPNLNGVIYGPSETAHGLEIWQEKEIQPLDKSVLEELWGKTVERAEQNCPTILCDVRTPNGSDPTLLQFLEGKNCSLLVGYAGWNTAGNTIGTALAHGTIYYLARQKGVLNETAHTEFMIERLLDDYAYQTIIRAELDELILGNSHWGTRHMLSREGWGQLNEVVQTNLQDWANKYLEKYKLPQVTVGAELPWPRIFEVQVHVNIKEELNQ